MELALITAQQVAVLFLLIGTGMVAVKTGVLKLENKQALSNLLVYIIVPAMVVNSYRMEFSAQILHNLLAAFGMSVLSVLLGTVITLLLTARKTGSRMPIFRFACIFSNAAYMGFPLISALFGSEGLLYASAYVTVFNILLWTLGYGLVSGGSSVKEVARSLVRTPVLYAMLFLQALLPAFPTHGKSYPPEAIEEKTTGKICRRRHVPYKRKAPVGTKKKTCKEGTDSHDQPADWSRNDGFSI